MHPKEVKRLWNQVEVGKDMNNSYIIGSYVSARMKRPDIFDVAIRAEDGNLIGFGAVAYKGENGELSDFVVSPDHQGQGVGKAIILERLRMAQDAGITSLYMPRLEHTNTLRSFYYEQGFVEREDGSLGYGPNPMPVMSTPHAPRNGIES